MFEILIGQAPNFQLLKENARTVASTEATVLITGETGTGKELLARAVQHHSLRADRPYITLNCAAMPPGLAESELFGHRRGAFTGAATDKTGWLKAADGGTVMLDEIDSLQLSIQAKLLRFLETGEIQAVGESYPEHLDVRVIAASNASLADKVAEGEVREDLYYRLNVVPLAIPPLREREGDIPILLDFYMAQFAAEHGMAESGFTRSAMKRLTAFPWPGNVRELRNLCERLSVLLPGRMIDEKHLPPEMFSRLAMDQAYFVLPETGIDLEQCKRELICQALLRAQGNRSRSARLLGITRDALIYRIKKYGINSSTD